MNRKLLPFFNKHLPYFLYGLSLVLILLLSILHVLTQIPLIFLASVNIVSLILIIRKFVSSPKTEVKQIDNPWTGQKETVKESDLPVSKDPSSFGSFLERSLKHIGFRIGSIEPSNPFHTSLLKRIMRLSAAGLIFVYTVVFFFSIGNPIALMFLVTDLVLFYMMWLSRR